MIHFHDAWGRSRSDIDRDLILAAIEEGGPTFWEGPAGQTALSCGDGADAPWLFLTQLPRGGFFIYGRRGIGPTLYLAEGSESSTASATIEIGGSPVEVPARFHTPPKEAARVAAHFMESGEFAPDASWVTQD